MKEKIPNPQAEQVAAIDRLSRSMGVNAEDLELFRTDRPAWEAKQLEKARPSAAPPGAGGDLALRASRTTAPAPARSRPVTLEAALDTDRLCIAMGVSRQDLARDRSDRVLEAIAAYRRGDALSSPQLALIASAAAAPTRIIAAPTASTPITPTAAAPTRIIAAPTASTPITPTAEELAIFERGRGGTLKMVSRAITEDGTR